MFKFISDLVYIYAVAKKYSLKIKWVFTKQVVGTLCGSEMALSLFNPGRKAIFLHEVGHYILNKRKRCGIIYPISLFFFNGPSLNGKELYSCLIEEIGASKFAVRADKESRNMLWKSFLTYTQSCFRARHYKIGNELDFERIISICYQADRRLLQGK